MKHFLIYSNLHKDPGLVTTKRIEVYLASKGQKTTLMLEGEETVPEDATCVIVLGGDGTMLQAARDLKTCHIPMIGFNLGTLGYMTEIEPEHLYGDLDQVIAGY